MMGDALRSLLLGRGQEESDMALPQVMRAYRSTPHTSTLEIPNFLMLGRETRVPDYLTYHIPDHNNPVHEYVTELDEHMRTHTICFERSNGRYGTRTLMSLPSIRWGTGS